MGRILLVALATGCVNARIDRALETFGEGMAELGDGLADIGEGLAAVSAALEPAPECPDEPDQPETAK